MLLVGSVQGTAPAQPQQAFLSLVVNEVAKGDVIAAIDGTRIWLPVAALQKAGLQGFAGQRDTLFGQPYVLMQSLEPGITTVLDMANVALNVTAAPQFFFENVVTMQRRRPVDLEVSHSAGGFLNYSATWDQTAGTSGYAETGLSMFGNTSLVSAFNAYPDGVVARGLTTLTIDRARRRQRAQFGDIVAAPTPLGSGPTVAGLAFGRDYSLDPYYFRYPSPFVRGTATSPSDVEIYVNGALVRRMQIGPGPYRLEQLPLNTGRGDISVVVRDRAGHEQTFGSTVYLASGLLRKGDQDFQYVAGKLRDDSGEAPVYRDWEAVAYHRVALTNWLTAGYSAEGSEHVAAGGPTLSVGLAKLGEAEIQAWASRTKSDTRGNAVYGLYSFASRRLNLSATAQYFSSGFSNLFMTPGSSSTPEFYQATAGVPVFDSGSLTYIWEARRSPAGNFGFTLPDGSFDASLVRSLAQSLRGSFRVFRHAQITATATLTNVRGEQQWSGFAGLNVVLSRTTTASVTYSSAPGSASTFIDLDRSVPVGVGYGYRVTASDVDRGTESAEFETNTRFNTVRMLYSASQGGDQQTTSFTLEGGLVGTRGGLFFTRQLQSSAAVVEVTGLKNVRILADNVPIGRTDGRGHLLIPDLLPYLANRISFNEADIPFQYSVPVQSQLVAPPFRGAAFVKFPTARIQARAGSIRMSVDGQEIVPSFGLITVKVGDGEVQSPLNAEGEFFLDLPDGHHTGTVTFKGKTCEVGIEATTSSELVQKLGVLQCGQ